jgi:hypothetical protein
MEVPRKGVEQWRAFPAAAVIWARFAFNVFRLQAVNSTRSQEFENSNLLGGTSDSFAKKVQFVACLKKSHCTMSYPKLQICNSTSINNTFTSCTVERRNTDILMHKLELC